MKKLIKRKDKPQFLPHLKGGVSLRKMMKNSEINEYLSDSERKSFLKQFCLDNEYSKEEWNYASTIYEWKNREADIQVMRVIFSKGRSIALTPPPEMLTKEIEDSQTRLSFLKGIAEELGISDNAASDSIDGELKISDKVIVDFRTRFDRLKTEIAQKRDELRDIISEAEDLADCNERALESMEEAADALSEIL